MFKRVVGIHVGHDASACILSDSGISMHLREEQLSSVKHFSGFPVKALQCIKKLIGSEAPDAIAFSTANPLYPATENSWIVDLKGSTSDLTSRYPNLPEHLRARSSTLSYIYEGFEERLHTSGRSLKALFDLGICDRTPRFYVHHHFSHASCFRVMGLDFSKVLTADGRGDGISSAAYAISSSGSLSYIGHRAAEASLGALYQCATEICGFLGIDSEYKLMGLSSYGKVDRRWADKIHEVVRSRALWSWRPYREVYPERSPNNPLQALVPIPVLIDARRDLASADFAATVQHVFETEMIGLLRDYLEPGDRVFCSGGLFLNARCNQRLVREFPTSSFQFFPDSGDSGLAIGCAAAATGRTLHDFTPFVGQANKCVDTECESNVLGEWVRRPTDFAFLVEQLLLGKCLGLCVGRSEIGPRALGARSILVNAFRADLKFELNARKRREPFIPVAPSVLASDASRLMELNGGEEFMLKTVNARPLLQEIAPSLVHVDGTVRPQVVRDDDTSIIAEILREVKRRTGVGIVANTSLNRSGYPTAGDLQEACECLNEGVVDFLVLGDEMISRKLGPRRALN
ncbi:carbamoyltransferase C-terminal domain-containing protein [Cereibacter sphaeroides]|uniref:carbamoyltransferase C-terminal domain-containing protein n=1 Tax=Cereibacter sphaeroides TaxID=1063 RepID=UPI003FCEE5F4